MSIEIYAFLGPNLNDLGPRVLDAFERIGFKTVFHPETDFLRSNPAGCMCLSVLDTPPFLKRLAPGTPLLCSFGYSASQRDESISHSDWPPKGVKSYSYEVYTRTSTGRSRSSYFFQALTSSILAKETGGYVWVNGDARAVSGKTAFSRVVAELSGIDASVKKLQDLKEELERQHGVVEANRFGRTMHNSLDAAFDVGAYPFTTWPPIESFERFSYPEPISLPPFVAKRERWWSKISFFKIFVFIVVTLLVLVTVIYS